MMHDTFLPPADRRTSPLKQEDPFLPAFQDTKRLQAPVVFAATSSSSVQINALPVQPGVKSQGVIQICPACTANFSHEAPAWFASHVKMCSQPKTVPPLIDPFSRPERESQDILRQDINAVKTCVSQMDLHLRITFIESFQRLARSSASASPSSALSTQAELIDNRVLSLIYTTGFANERAAKLNGNPSAPYSIRSVNRDVLAYLTSGEASSQAVESMNSLLMPPPPAPIPSLTNSASIAHQLSEQALAALPSHTAGMLNNMSTSVNNSMSVPGISRETSAAVFSQSELTRDMSFGFFGTSSLTASTSLGVAGIGSLLSRDMSFGLSGMSRDMSTGTLPFLGMSRDISDGFSSGFLAREASAAPSFSSPDFAPSRAVAASMPAAPTPGLSSGVSVNGSQPALAPSRAFVDGFPLGDPRTPPPISRQANAKSLDFMGYAGGSPSPMCPSPTTSDRLSRSGLVRNLFTPSSPSNRSAKPKGASVISKKASRDHAALGQLIKDHEQAWQNRMPMLDVAN